MGCIEDVRLCLCLVIAFMDISGLPGVILEITVADVDAYIIPLMINFILIVVIAITVIKIFNIKYKFGFEIKGKTKLKLPLLYPLCFLDLDIYLG